VSSPRHGGTSRSGSMRLTPLRAGGALTGFAYSTSFLSQEALGDKAQKFERDLAALLFSYEPEGVFRVPASYSYQLARRPGST
jgi:hypothetical protein